LDLAREGRDIRRRGEVAANERELELVGAQLLLELPAGLFVDVGPDHRRALLAERPARNAADAADRSRDHGCLALEPAAAHDPLSLRGCRHSISRPTSASWRS